MHWEARHFLDTHAQDNVLTSKYGIRVTISPIMSFIDLEKE